MGSLCSFIFLFCFVGSVLEEVCEVIFLLCCSANVSKGTGTGVFF